MQSQQKQKHRHGSKLNIKLVMAALFILLQIALVYFSVYFFVGQALWLYTVLQLVSMVIVIYIVNKRGNPSYKITWIIYILIFPLLGGIVYLFWGGGRVFPHVKRKMRLVSEGSHKFVRQDPQVKNRLIYDDIQHARQSYYLARSCGFPVYDSTNTVYLSPGETALPVILDELRKAERYIFLEFFILAEDSMWDEIFAILKEKQKQNVEVRILFDDFGSITRQYRDFAKRLRQAGLKVAVFNKIRPSVDIFLNNRNHRKIIVIDGKVAFTGGMNIADEYVNRFERFGYWMDCAIMLKGNAVTSFVVMFLSMWGFCENRKQNYGKYILPCPSTATGFVQPYCDGPTNDRNPAEGIYMQILNTAQKYVYIVSPYLIVDNTMVRELTLAANSGIDVRIITPKKPDKWYVHPVTQYSYDELLAAGIRIYEYTPGFIHSKLFVSDDRVATVGTVNMDYRSFFFHFECGVWMCGTDSVSDIKAHFLNMLTQSEEIKLKNWRKRPWTTKTKQFLLHLFAPFM